MENSLKGLMLAAGVIITCIVVGLGFYIAREAKGTAIQGANQISQLNGEFSDTTLSLYDQTEVSGSEVINAIRKFQNQVISIKVNTGKAVCEYLYRIDEATGRILTKSNQNLELALDKTSPYYINPTGKFRARLTRDVTNMVTRIEFIQQ